MEYKAFCSSSVFFHKHLKDFSNSLIFIFFFLTFKNIFIDISGQGLGLGRGRAWAVFSSAMLSDTGEASHPLFMFLPTSFWQNEKKTH